MELHQLQIFCTAAQTLNFTKAAAKLGYAQSNITSQIKHLERELNIKLFERFGRGIQLTSEGKRFLHNAEIILTQCERAKEEFSPNVVRGILTIGSAETLCVYRLPQILLEYRKKYPLVEIRVQTENYHHLIELIRNNVIDVALTLTDKIEHPDMAINTLYREPMVIVTHPLHKLAHKKIVTPIDLSNECLIISEAGGGYRPIFLSMLHDYHVMPGAVMELSSVGAMKECTACGLGYTILPKIAVQDELDRDKLTALNWHGPHFNVKTQLIYHQKKWLSPIIQAFLELCKHMGEN